MCQLIYNTTACVQNICHQQTSVLCIIHTTLSMVLLMTLCCNAVTSGTQKTELSSNKSIKLKDPVVYHSKTKFSFGVSIILANINE